MFEQVIVCDLPGCNAQAQTTGQQLPAGWVSAIVSVGASAQSTTPPAGLVGQYDTPAHALAAITAAITPPA